MPGRCPPQLPSNAPPAQLTTPSSTNNALHLSDTWGRTPFFGNMDRRRPFMFLCAPLFAVALICLMGVPFASEGDLQAPSVAYFGAFYILFFLLNTSIVIPYVIVSFSLSVVCLSQLTLLLQVRLPGARAHRRLPRAQQHLRPVQRLRRPGRAHLHWPPLHP